MDTVKRYIMLRRKILLLFRAGEDQVFEDGMESEFSRYLVSTIKDYGSGAISIISDLILNEQVDPEVASEALRWIGYIADPETHVARLNLLKRCLNHSHPWVRDGASLGLAYLDEPSAIPSLEAAIEREKYELLRRNINLVIEDLHERE